MNGQINKKGRQTETRSNQAMKHINKDSKTERKKETEEERQMFVYVCLLASGGETIR